MVSFRAPIPKGLRLKAQGCEERATLGKGTKRESTPMGLRLLCDGSTQPRRCCGHPSEPGSAALSPTLGGWMTHSLALKMCIKFRTEDLRLGNAFNTSAEHILFNEYAMAITLTNSMRFSGCAGGC